MLDFVFTIWIRGAKSIGLFDLIDGAYFCQYTYLGRYTFIIRLSVPHGRSSMTV